MKSSIPQQPEKGEVRNKATDNKVKWVKAEKEK